MKNHESRLQLLVTLFALFGAFWIWSFSALMYFAKTQAQYPAGGTYLGIALLFGFSYPVFLYLVKVLYCLYHETRRYVPHKSWGTNDERAQELYADIMSRWHWIVVLALFLLALRFIVWLPLTALNIILIIILLGIGGVYVKHTTTHDEKSWYMSGVLAIVFFLYFVVVITLTSGVDITYNKAQYTLNETVLVEVKPYGIIPPRIINVTYFNEHAIYIHNESEGYPASPRFLTIPSDLLTTRPYNSHIIVTYSYFGKDFLGIGQHMRDSAIKVTPVYDSTNS